MRIWHLVDGPFKRGLFTGVPRFDHELRVVFTGMETVNYLPSEFNPKFDVVIAEDHKSIEVPEETKTIVVNHTCARVKYDLDKSWRKDRTKEILNDQERMFYLRNRTYVASSGWLLEQFSRHHGLPVNYGMILPNWVHKINRPPIRRRNTHRYVIIGDWRTPGSGSLIIEKMRRKYPEFDFKQLKCTHIARQREFSEADAYICLSKSEGSSYTLADAEAADLPIVSTPTGNIYEFQYDKILDINKLDNLEHISSQIHNAIIDGKNGQSYYSSYRFNEWANAWKNIIYNLPEDLPAIL